MGTSVRYTGNEAIKYSGLEGFSFTLIFFINIFVSASHWSFEFLLIASDLFKVYIIFLVTQFINVSQNLNPVSLLFASHLLSMASQLTKHAHNSTHSPPVCLLLPQIWFCCGSAELSAEIWATLHCFPDAHNEELVGTDACCRNPVFLCSYCSHGWGRKIYKDQRQPHQLLRWGQKEKPEHS